MTGESMAIYHLSAKAISRGKGQSAVAAAAYRSGDVLRNEQDGKLHNYERKQHVETTFIRGHSDTPEWCYSRERLWNEVEGREKSKKAQLAKEITVALPRELDARSNQKLVEAFVDRNFASQGAVVDVAIHTPLAGDGKQNPHAHLLIPLRTISKTDGWGKYKSGGKGQPWDKIPTLKAWRKDWKELVNQALEDAGHDDRIDHRSYKAQGIDKEPGVHLGPEAVAMEKRGERTKRGDQLRKADHLNRVRAYAGTVKRMAATSPATTQPGQHPVQRFLFNQVAQAKRLYAQGRKAVSNVIERFAAKLPPPQKPRGPQLAR